MNILVTTMGASWQILPELLGFTNPGLIDLFKNHPEKNHIEKTRQSHGILAADEVWTISSCGDQSEKSLDQMTAWYRALDAGTRPVLRVWKVGGTDALSTELECRKMSEGIYTVVCHAASRVRGGCLMLSLTGGRKTMSTDMQQAGAWFGCDAVIHVVDDPGLTGTLKPLKWGLDRFLAPLEGEAAHAYTPFCLAGFDPYPLAGQIRPDDFPLPFSDRPEAVLFHPPRHFPLTTKIADQRADAGFLMSNYTNRMLQGEVITNFLALYSLPEKKIDQMKSMMFGRDRSSEMQELAVLKSLPKADLHCHLGGVATPEEQIRIAEAAAADVAKHRHRLAPCLENWRELIRTHDPEIIQQGLGPLKNIRRAVPEVPEAVCTAALLLLFRDCPDLLARVLTWPFEDESRFCGRGFEFYEKTGDLQGSAMLSHPACLEAACRILAEKALDHHVLYLEVRCSPVKYVSERQNGMDVCRKIMEVFSDYEARLKVSLIFTASRHGDIGQIKDHVGLAQSLCAGGSIRGPVPLQGFDLAGNEAAGSASDMRQFFLPMMRDCLHFTIHAGENVAADSIWEAVYFLSAERIGHGLTLKDNPRLMEKFLDRNIALEMCPSSNFQIVGYKDNYLPETRGHEVYPLRHYLDQGLAVTVNTDNPGISGTDFTRELHRACRMTPGGLSLWEILSIIRNSFKVSFAPRSIKHALLKKAEQRVVGVLTDFFKNR